MLIKDLNQSAQLLFKSLKPACQYRAESVRHGPVDDGPFKLQSFITI